jgi:hypothetical protein
MGILFLICVFLTSTTALSVVPLQTPPAWESNDNTYSTGGGLGDVDGDGYLDLFVGNGNDMDYEPNHIYSNIGGIFEMVASWSSSDSNFGGHLALGDVNSDGELDMVVANYADANNWSLRWLDDLYLNIGSFLNPVPVWNTAPSDADNSFSCAFGDVDGDGDLDLAVACGESYSSTPQISKVYMNIGGVMDTLPSWTSEIGYAYGVAWGDVDGDGDLDLALGRDGETNQVYFNNGGVLDSLPGWESTETDGTNQITFGDVNGDKYVDLAVSNTFGLSNVKVYYNTGTGLETTASWSSRDVKNYYSCVAWGDVDGDGDQDLASGGWWEPVVVFENLGGVLDTLPTWSWLTANPSNLVCEEVVWGDVDNGGIISVAGETHTFFGQRDIVYLDHYPAHSLERVILNNDTLNLGEFSSDIMNGWVSIGAFMPDSVLNSVALDYTYSTNLDLVVTNWHEARGNFLFLNGGVGIEEIVESTQPGRNDMRLFQSQPNPFNKLTAISYQLRATTHTTLKIFDLSGRLVETLVNQDQKPGTYKVMWKPKGVASGIYFYRLTARTGKTINFSTSRKVNYVK